MPWRCGQPGATKPTRGFNVLWRGRMVLSLVSALWAVSAGGPGGRPADNMALLEPCVDVYSCIAPIVLSFVSLALPSCVRGAQPGRTWKPTGCPCWDAAVPAPAHKQPLGGELFPVFARSDELDGRRMDVQVCCCMLQQRQSWCKHLCNLSTCTGRDSYRSAVICCS